MSDGSKTLRLVLLGVGIGLIVSLLISGGFLRLILGAVLVILSLIICG